MENTKINDQLLKLEHDDVFAKVTQKVSEYKKQHPESELVSLGIGDVSRPIVKPVIEAMHKAVDDLANMSTFKGYGAYYGFDFLKEAILKNEYDKYDFSLDEIYVSNGTKTDTTSILELFPIDSKVLIGNPMYPIYRDGAIAMNREVYEVAFDENFKMIIPQESYDIVYLCSPSNPLGNALSKEDLSRWVEYARKHNAILLFDNVYNAFVRSKDVPSSIYEIAGSKGVAIEFRSFSKNISFTSMRCSYYVIPKEIAKDVNLLWKRRTINRFNGADYIAQRGALAAYQEDSKALIKENIDYYLENGRILKQEFEALGFSIYGGEDAPYLWVKTKDNLDSWQMFDVFLNEMQIVIIPGIIFGKYGNKFFRVSALGNRVNNQIAIERMKKYYEKEN